MIRQPRLYAWSSAEIVASERDGRFVGEDVDVRVVAGVCLRRAGLRDVDRAARDCAAGATAAVTASPAAASAAAGRSAAAVLLRDVQEYLALKASVDVILLDLNLRDGSRPDANVGRLLETGAAVLVISTIPDAEHVLATIEAGAAGYVTKDNDLPALIDAVREVAAGGVAISQELAFVLSTDRRPGRPVLSPQESLVLRTYASGATLQATARRAGIAYGTAREYLERIKRKYTDAGRPTRTKLDLVERAREDRLELDGL